MAVILFVQKIQCKGCAQHVIDAANKVLPAAKVSVDLATKKVIVDPTPDDPTRLLAAISEAGYEAQIVQEGEQTMGAEFLARRSAARARLNAMNPHMKPGGDPADPFGDRWFAKVYELAGDDVANIPWAALNPNPLLAEWLSRDQSLYGKRALDVGCGLGDNAEALAAARANVVAFDYVERAVTWAQRRFPDSSVDYRVADLFAAPKEWTGAFDLVHECYTLQTLNEEILPRAATALASFVAPGGYLLVISSAREPSEPQTTPWRPLTRIEIESLGVDGLSLQELDDIPRQGCVSRRWRAVFSREAG